MTTEAAIELLPDSVTSPVWRAPVSWRTRQCIRIVVLMHRNFPLSVSVTGFVGLLSIAPFIITTMFLAKIDRRLAVVPLILGPPLVSGFLLWINGRLSHRTDGRAATASEVAALRCHCTVHAWRHVQASAADWRHYRPRAPITITMILRWQDEAAAKEREAMPPTVAVQAAIRAQARDFGL